MSAFDVFMKNITVKRKASGHYTDGLWVDVGENTLTIKGDLQPLTPNEMQSLPEGRRIDDSQILYTETFLRSVVGNDNPDVVLVEGVRYEVVKVYDWSGYLKHYKVLISKVEQGL
jgi:hypothetical protein